MLLDPPNWAHSPRSFLIFCVSTRTLVSNKRITTRPFLRGRSIGSPHVARLGLALVVQHQIKGDFRTNDLTTEVAHRTKYIVTVDIVHLRTSDEGKGVVHHLDHAWQCLCLDCLRRLLTRGCFAHFWLHGHGEVGGPWLQLH